MTGIWNTLKSGTFVTIYFNIPFISENVYCCMSNGISNDKVVVGNVIESSKVCVLDDSRTSRSSNPKFVEITVLAAPKRWRPIPNWSQNISRERHRTIHLSATDIRTGHHLGSAVYLPTVWNERPDWSAVDLINSLAEKATDETITDLQDHANVVVSEIDSYTITQNTSSSTIQGIDQGLFSFSFGSSSPLVAYRTVLHSHFTRPSIAASILKKAWQFYVHFSNPLTHALVYIFKPPNQIQYDNEGAVVRTLADVTAFIKLAQLLDVADTPSVQAVEQQALKRYNLSGLDNAQNVAALGELMLALKNNFLNLKNAKAIENKLYSFWNEKYQNFDDADLAFATPQIMLVLAKLYVLTHNPRTLYLARWFIQNYEQNLDTILTENGTFAANWILQAISEIFVAMSTLESSRTQGLCHKRVATL